MPLLKNLFSNKKKKTSKAPKQLSSKVMAELSQQKTSIHKQETIEKLTAIFGGDNDFCQREIEVCGRIPATILYINSPYQIAYFNGLTSQNPGGATEVVILSENQSVMFQSTRRKAKYETMMKNGKPHFKVSVDVWGILREKNTSQLKIDDPHLIHRIEHTTGNKIEQEMKKLINETQGEKSDIFGFGEYARGELSDYWDDEIKTTTRWKEVYEKIEVEVHANVYIKRIGMKAT